MVALTYGDGRVSSAETKTSVRNATIPVTPAKSRFARFLAAMMESRMRQAEREIRLHARLLPPLHIERAELPFQDVTAETPRGGW
jgi:hypothetical protein